MGQSIVSRVLVGTPTLTVTRQDGWEPIPSWEPSEYKEYKAVLPGKRVVLHLGLVDWISVNGNRTADAYRARDRDRLWEVFTKLVGHSPAELEQMATG